MQKPANCIFPKCKNKSRSGRGLCDTHYNAISHYVRRKETTWELLEKNGLALPITGRRGYGDVSVLLKEKGLIK